MVDTFEKRFDALRRQVRVDRRAETQDEIDEYQRTLNQIRYLGLKAIADAKARHEAVARTGDKKRAARARRKIQFYVDQARYRIADFELSFPRMLKDRDAVAAQETAPAAATQSELPPLPYAAPALPSFAPKLPPLPY